MRDITEHIEKLKIEFDAIQTLSDCNYQFDIAEYSVRTDENIESNLDDIKTHILTSRPSNQTLRIIVVRTSS